MIDILINMYNSLIKILVLALILIVIVFIIFVIIFMYRIFTCSIKQYCI